jgi:hypothetical protein
MATQGVILQLLVKQPEDLMDSPRARSGGIGILVAIVVGIVLLATLLFIPLQRCTYCGSKRKEIHDWMQEPILKKYREDHPEALLAAQADLDRIDQDCLDCFHGRVTLWSELRNGSFRSHR